MLNPAVFDEQTGWKTFIKTKGSHKSCCIEWNEDAHTKNLRLSRWRKVNDRKTKPRAVPVSLSFTKFSDMSNGMTNRMWQICCNQPLNLKNKGKSAKRMTDDTLPDWCFQPKIAKCKAEPPVDTIEKRWPCRKWGPDAPRYAKGFHFKLSLINRT